MGEPADIEHDLGVLQGAVVTAFAGQQALDADLAGLLLIGPAVAVGRHEALAVVLVHRGVDALLRIGGGGDQVHPEAGIHGGVGTGGR